MIRPGGFLILLEEGEERGDRRPDVVRKTIDDPLPVPDVFHEAGVPEDPELMGNAGLSHLQDEHELADAEVPLKEQPDDPQAGRIGEGFEHAKNVGHGLASFQCPL